MIVNDSKIAVDSHYYIYTPSVLAEKLYLYPLSIGHFQYEPNYSLTREKFDSFLIMFIVKGTCDISNGGNQFTARSGQFVLLDCYSPHSYESSESWEALWIHFDGQLARSYFQEISNQHGHVLTLEDTTTTYLHLEQIYTLFHSSSAISEANISTLITELLNDLLRGKENKLHGNHSEPVARAVKYINQNFKKQLSIETLAKKANSSTYHFIRTFTKETGVTPYQYVMNTRIAAARFLLKASDVSIKDIAFSTGFQSESSFCTCFKKIEQLTPSQYRKQIY